MDKIKLTFFDRETQFFVNEEKKTVVCKMSAYLLIPDVFDNIDVWGDRFRVKAIAKCCPGDVFNEEIGKRIARAKAESKAYKYAIEYSKGIMTQVIKAKAMLNNFIEKGNKSIEHNAKYIDSITSDVYSIYKLIGKSELNGKTPEDFVKNFIPDETNSNTVYLIYDKRSKMYSQWIWCENCWFNLGEEVTLSEIHDKEKLVTPTPVESSLQGKTVDKDNYSTVKSVKIDEMVNTENCEDKSSVKQIIRIPIKHIKS